jgi:phage baseplate assembly protein V
MTADIAELTRLLNNLIRIGTIAEIDYVAVRARVRLGPTLLSDWRPWAAQRAGNAQTWWAPSKGEPIVFLSPGGDLARGVITQSLYSEAAPAPSHSPNVSRTNYPDGAYVQYDHGNHAMEAILPADSSATLTADSITVNASTVTANAQKITCNAPDTTCTGDLTVGGNLAVAGSSALNGGANVKAGKSGKAMHVDGVIEATKDVIANGKSGFGHTHDVFGVGAPTSTPKAVSP